MSSRLAPILLAAVLVVLAFVIFGGKRGEQRAAQRPAAQDTVVAMVQAAQNGDTDAYLDCFWGPLRTRLEQTSREMGRREFARHLERTASAIKGVVAHGEPEPKGADLKVQAEMVYEDKNEAQGFILTRRRGRWRISAMENPQRIETIIPYGSEAYRLMPPADSEEQEPSP